MATDEKTLAARLKEFIVTALRDQKSERVTRGIAQRLDAGKLRVVAEFDPDENGDLDPLTLTYQVDVFVDDGWAGLCSIEWPLLGLDAEDLAREVANVQAQREMGITIDDLSADIEGDDGA